MMDRDNPRLARLTRDTRVLFHIRDTDKYLMTNSDGDKLELLPVFEADREGKVSMEGLLLGSIFAHDPYLIPKLETVDRPFGALSPAYFDARPVIDGLIGLAVGDAFGVPVEFMSREEARRLDVRDMLGCDGPLPFASRWSEEIPKGAWSDDTSMTIAAMASIADHRGDIDFDDIMKRFLAWWDEGKYSSLDFPFGLGGNISHAFTRFRVGMPALECGGKGYMDNGNGALMRMFPFSIYCVLKGYDDEQTLDLIRKASGITHGHEISALSCYIYTQFLAECLRTKNPARAYRLAVSGKEAHYGERFSPDAMKAHKTLFEKLGQKDFNPDSIPESGYVVDSLTIALYSILHTDNYEDAVRLAVDFGYDTDTNAAITGSIAGAMYGMAEIPARWLRDLRKKDELLDIAARFEACVLSE